MTHAPFCLEYMQRVRNPQVFAFCAIPQIMAIATLSLCYNNGRVFEGVVKLRRGQTAHVCPCPLGTFRGGARHVSRAQTMY